MDWKKAPVWLITGAAGRRVLVLIVPRDISSTSPSPRMAAGFLPLFGNFSKFGADILPSHLAGSGGFFGSVKLVEVGQSEFRSGLPSST